MLARPISLCLSQPAQKRPIIIHKLPTYTQSMLKRVASAESPLTLLKQNGTLTRKSKSQHNLLLSSKPPSPHPQHAPVSSACPQPSSTKSPNKRSPLQRPPKSPLPKSSLQHSSSPVSTASTGTATPSPPPNKALFQPSPHPLAQSSPTQLVFRTSTLCNFQPIRDLLSNCKQLLDMMSSAGTSSQPPPMLSTMCKLLGNSLRRTSCQFEGKSEWFVSPDACVTLPEWGYADVYTVSAQLADEAQCMEAERSLSSSNSRSKRGKGSVRVQMLQRSAVGEPWCQVGTTISAYSDIHAHYTKQLQQQTKAAVALAAACTCVRAHPESALDMWTQVLQHGISVAGLAHYLQAFADSLAAKSAALQQQHSSMPSAVAEYAAVV